MFARRLRLAGKVCAVLVATAAGAMAADQDGDGVDDAIDVCCNTPPNIPVDAQGRPIGDIDGDCDCDLNDFALLNLSYTGPLANDCCTSNIQCPDGQYCNKSAGDCDGEGQCESIPVTCPLIFDPVCGCDGLTYANACFAAQAGVSIDYAGVCLGCSDNTACPAGTYCAKSAGDCDGVGQCEPTPDHCLLVYEPVCGCDGNTYSNACWAAAGGVNVAHAGPCFACTENADCSACEYCNKALGDCDGTGECLPLPDACPAVYDPVCGCDGIQYDNACLAAQAGVSVDYTGPCHDCQDNAECPAGQFCNKNPGDCGGTGLCTPFPPDCAAVYDPVCGCDGNTYSNECVAAQAGVSVAFAGECPPSCQNNSECQSGEYCNPGVGNCGGAGLCDPIPTNCPIVYIPVCGCDGQTYGNACMAAASGVGVAFAGECPAGCTTNSQCPAGNYCNKAIGDCAGVGNCAPMPSDCLNIFDPVCGCDGITYLNACVAAQAGVSLFSLGQCPPQLSEQAGPAATGSKKAGAPAPAPHQP